MAKSKKTETVIEDVSPTPTGKKGGATKKASTPVGNSEIIEVPYQEIFDGTAECREEKLIHKALRFAKEGQMSALEDAYAFCEELLRKGSIVVETKNEQQIIYNEEFQKLAIKCCREIRQVAVSFLRGGDATAESVYRKSLKLIAPFCLDEAIRYAEFDRPYDKKFYEPRRKQLKPIVDELQRLEDGEIELLTISLPPGVGKTTLAIFFLIWTECRHPELSVLGGSHSNSFLRGVYDEVERMLDPYGEYLWYDIFPHCRIVATNAKDMRIDLQKEKRFQSFEFSSIGSGNAGKVRCSNILYCDDLVDGIETAMSRDRLDKLYQQYHTDLRQRKIGRCKELHIATRWSVADVIGRLEMQYEGSDKAKFISIPATDENGNSNFDYPYHLGFTTDFYRQQKEIMDEASWNALYMNEPIEREGQLYHPSELRRYFTLPDKEPDAIITVCDIADGGGDFWVCPVAYRYGNDYYIDDFICDNGKPDIVEERIVNMLVDKKVHLARVETNRGGGRVAESIQKKVKAKNGLTKITTKWNQTQKETRIIMASGIVKQNFLFKDESEYSREYKTAMNMLCGYTMSGKNKHDDVPDAMSMLVDLIRSYEMNTVKVKARPF